MSFHLLFTAHYERIEARFLKSHPELRRVYNKTLQLILSYRITLELLIQDQRIILINIGNHDAVY